MTPKEELIQAIERSPDGIVQELLGVLKALQAQQVTTEIATEPLQKRHPAKAGSAKGRVWISDDFDEPLEDFKEYME
ncbi:DUF2281 domain-containing protein [Calothrix sp. PCC 6303]|uniref:DUF2281 domain-containing protein n=1 Tax=Calothrix sp. PCC 6303 TaxID=1170562 RepID=UPI0002A02435|nr:DUF2281 domain-containing protein [Calothrix sp. PCC 6303]AFZ01896.1 hypothetical protein Cal6303_2947 [Calothrix sp. PCC 6303]